MSSTPLLNNDTILHDFIRAMEPDISDSDLQSFVSDFLSNETKQNVILTQRSKTVVTENGSQPNIMQHEMLVRLVKEAVFHFLDTKYKESAAVEKMIAPSSNLLLEDHSEMEDLKVMVDQLVSEKEKMSQRLEQLEDRHSHATPTFSPGIKSKRALLLLLVSGIVVSTFFMLSRKSNSILSKSQPIKTSIATSNLASGVGILNQVKSLYKMAIVKKTSEINLSRKETSVAIEEVKSNSAVPKAITPAVNENIPIAKSNTSVLESTTSDSSSQVQTQGVSNFRPKRSSKVVAAQGRSAKMVKSKSRSKAKNQKSVYFGEQY